MRGSKTNIRRILNAADETDVSEGRVSYWRYHEVLKNLAEFYGVPLGPVVAVFCSLSPNNDYRGNLRSAATVIRGFVEGVPCDQITVTTFNHCRDRAYLYLTGERDFLATASGPKIKSFYLNIFNPMNPEPITIDGHAVNIWRNKKVSLQAVAISRFKYEAVANDYREVAEAFGLLPHQLQAITWFAWKRIHTIVYPGRQLELFRDISADLWKTLVDPRTIETFPFRTEPNPSKLRPRSAGNAAENIWQNENQEPTKNLRQAPPETTLHEPAATEQLSLNLKAKRGRN